MVLVVRRGEELGDRGMGGGGPFSELTMLVLLTLTSCTTLSERPPTEPMETPWPPY